MKTLDLTPGAEAWLGDLAVTVRAAAGLDTVMVETADGSLRTVPVSALTTGPEVGGDDSVPDILSIPDQEWEVARRREAVIRPLAAAKGRSRELVAEAAAALGCSTPLVYRLLKRYLADPRATSLLPRKRGKKVGSKLVDGKVEAVISATIEEMYMTRQKVTGSEIAMEARRRCRGAGLVPPGRMTVFRRIAEVPRKAAVKAREGVKASEAKFLPAVGSFPETSWPLQVVQIDHTPIDAIIVDEVHRKPIGRPWLTLAIDVHTRMVTGFLLSLDPPSATSVALCIVHMVLPKEDWLARRGIDAKWPVWGKPDTIHVDNGKDFRSEALRRGCEQHGITLDYRPVRTPRYGGHIERLIGTMMGKVHLLPGTTFSNIGEKGDYDSEGAAVMALPELEEWFARAVVETYHQSLHAGVGMSPLAKWERGVLGTDEAPGRGLPTRVVDPERFLIDFLPLERRSVTREGIRLNSIFYWSDTLRPLVSDGGSHVVRYDPRDLSRVWLMAPDGEYYALPYRTRHRPPISLWEHREALRSLREEGRRTVDEDAIFAGVERMRAIVEEAAAKTKKARRQAERRRSVERAAPSKPLPLPEPEDEGVVEAPRRAPKRFEVEEW